MDIQQQIFGLLAAAEDQQKAVQSALDGLNAERAKLAQVTAKVENSVPALRNATQEAVKAAVGASVSGAAKTAVEAIEAASGPLISQLTTVVTNAKTAEAELSETMTGLGWKWAATVVASTFGGVLAILGTAWLTLEWNRAEIASLSEERQALLAQVTELQAGVAALKKRGGRIVMNSCGGRLCIEASRDQDDGWHTTDGRNVTLVIPNGY